MWCGCCNGWVCSIRTSEYDWTTFRSDFQVLWEHEAADSLLNGWHQDDGKSQVWGPQWTKSKHFVSSVSDGRHSCQANTSFLILTCEINPRHCRVAQDGNVHIWTWTWMSSTTATSVDTGNGGDRYSKWWLWSPVQHIFKIRGRGNVDYSIHRRNYGQH